MKTGNWFVVFAMVSLCVVFIAHGCEDYEQNGEDYEQDGEGGQIKISPPIDLPIVRGFDYDTLSALIVDAVPRPNPTVITHISSFLNTPSYNYTLAPMGEVVSADGTPIEKPLNGDIVLHNLRVLQAMVEKHERMYQFLLEKFGCKPYDHGRNCFKE